MRYVRRRQIIKVKKMKVKPIAHKVRRFIAKKHDKDVWSARDLSLPNRTIKHRCVAYKETGFLDVMYAHPYNKRGIDEVYIIVNNNVTVKKIRPAHWPKKKQINRHVHIRTRIPFPVHVGIDSLPVEMKI